MDFNALYNSLQSYASGGMLHNFILGACLLVGTAIVAHMCVRTIRHVVQLDGVPLPSSSILVNIARIAIWCLGLGLILSICFKVDVNALIAALGVGGIALSLGLQDTIKNFIGGLQVTLLRIVQPGDHIIVGSVEGIVHDVSWRQTVVIDFEGIAHIIPNSVINANDIAQIRPPSLVTATIVVTNDGRDLDKLLRVMEEKARLAVEKIAPLEKNPWMLVTQMGEYGAWVKMRFILKEPENVREARDAALRAVAPYARLNVEDTLTSEDKVFLSMN
jgi:small-conductance mechanosensitive channel